MRKPYLALVATGALVLAGGLSAEAGGRGGGPSMTPAGFGSMGGHRGFETFTHRSPSGTITQQRLPGGWDEGKAAWKSGLQRSNPILTTRPPGLSRH